MREIFYWIGVVVSVCGGVAITGCLFYYVAWLSIYVQRYCLESFGGWKVFYEFREWYHGGAREEWEAKKSSNKNSTTP